MAQLIDIMITTGWLVVMAVVGQVMIDALAVVLAVMAFGAGVVAWLLWRCVKVGVMRLARSANAARRGSSDCFSRTA